MKDSRLGAIDREIAAMSDHDDYQFDEPVGDEFDDLLATMHSSHTPKPFKQYVRRIHEGVRVAAVAARLYRKNRDVESRVTDA